MFLRKFVSGLTLTFFIYYKFALTIFKAKKYKVVLYKGIN